MQPRWPSIIGNIHFAHAAISRKALALGWSNSKPGAGALRLIRRTPNATADAAARVIGSKFSKSRGPRCPGKPPASAADWYYPGWGGLKARGNFLINFAEKRPNRVGKRTHAALRANR